MGTDYIKRLRFVDKMHNHNNDQERFKAKIQKCYPIVKKFIDIEIKKGVNALDAIDSVLESDTLKKLHPELGEPAVKIKVRSLLINNYLRKSKSEDAQR